MSKKISFAAKPSQASSLTPDDWVSRTPAESSAPSPEATTVLHMMKRLTIDVPADLHARVKAGCALKRVNMADELRRLLESHFPDS